VTVPPGADYLSDPIDFQAEPFEDVSVSLYLPEAPQGQTGHPGSRSTSYVLPGDRTGDADLPGAATADHWYQLSGIEAAAPRTSEAIAILGDSITDGFGVKPGENTRWPDFLANRLKSKDVDEQRAGGVLDESLSGNAVNHAGSEIGFPAIGHNGLARLDHDVYADTAVKAVIVQLGINDIQQDNDTATNIIAGLQQLGQQLRQRGYTAIIATLGPFEGYPSWTADKETTRQSVNAYIRANHDFDAVMDLDAALRDPASPSHVRPDLDSGDHIHPNAAGAQLLANAVPLDRL